MNRNAERGRATRDQLVDVATGLFAEHGYEATSIEAVLRTAAVSRGSLYHHFPGGKEALFLAVLERLGDRIDADLAAATRGATSPVEALRAGCRAWIDLVADPVVRQAMLIDAPAVLGWARWREIDERNTLGTIRAAMGAAAAAGRIDPAHADVFAHILLAAVNEVSLMIARADDPAAAREQARAALDDFLGRLLGSG